MAVPDVGTCASFGFETVKRNPLFCILGAFLVSVITSTTAGILAGPMYVGFIRGLEKERTGGQADIDDLFSGFDNLGASILVGVLGALATSIGLSLCCIPGLIVAPVFVAALIIVARGETDGIEAIKRAWAACQPHIGSLAVATLVLGLLGMSGVLACGIGLFVTQPIMYVGLYRLVEELAEGSA